jgi:hypothetical protein
MPAWIVSDQELTYNVSEDLKIHYHKRIEIFDSLAAANLLAKQSGRARQSRDIGIAIGTRRRHSDFSFAAESAKTLTQARPGQLIIGSKTIRLNGTAAGPTVTVDVKDHGSIVAALRQLFNQVSKP